MKKLCILKTVFALMGFSGVILFIGAVGSVDIDAISLGESVKYMLVAGLILVLSFLGTVVTEYLQSVKVTPDNLSDVLPLLDLYEDEHDVCARAECSESETGYDNGTGITTEALRMCPFGHMFESAERAVMPDEDHTEAYVGGDTVRKAQKKTAGAATPTAKK